MNTMRILITTLSVLTIFFSSCGKKQGEQEVTVVENKIDLSNYEFFGERLATELSFLSKEEMSQKFANLQSGDTIIVSFSTKIQEVCQKKGCWMKVDLGEDKSSFVRFKDYSFFAPMNAADHDVVLNGKAFVSIVTVDELKHYAKDAGQSQEEIDKIVEPKVTYSFEADGIGIAK